MSDWADELARKIADDLGVYGPDPSEPDRLSLVAARLRLLRQEGIGIGLDQASKAISSTGKQP